MAEVIGVVSGAITFATVLAQITQAVIKLKDFRDQFKDAPEDLKWVVRELEVFQNTMAGMETQLSNSTSAALPQTNYSAHQSLELCKEAADNLSVASQNFFNGLPSSGRFKKSTATMRLVMNRGSIDRQMGRLQRAIRLLGVAQQCYTMFVSSISVKIHTLTEPDL